MKLSANAKALGRLLKDPVEGPRLRQAVKPDLLSKHQRGIEPKLRAAVAYRELVGLAVEGWIIELPKRGKKKVRRARV